MLEQLHCCLQQVREKTPLVHAITNYVTVNDCANILLAAGASPAMCEAADETFDFSQIASALYLNTGTLTREQEVAMLLAIRGATIKKVPVILDPVACGAIPKKLDFIRKLRHFGDISVIKGNMAEIKALLGVETKARGVDSLDDGDDGVEVCQTLAEKFNCIVAATGKTDIITDGDRVCLVDNGSEMLGKITGTGCMLGALTAGFCGASDDLFLATCAAHLTMALAGELAAENDGGTLPGTFKKNLFNQIYLMNENTMKEQGKVQWQ
ncbi:MAG: hydroxyethylthiazole kinase [Thermoanaerobacteraceae bacterium]|nr:hydroxyethylthiazole kinase [Thermoanaerobacteraceae bacterium]